MKSAYSLKWQFDDLLRPFQSASIICADGSLLFSKDQSKPSFLTTKLVVSQIFRKYLAPKKGDLFVMNDPENGAFSFEHLFFFAPISPTLSLVWHQPSSEVDFKIPPTPLFDQSKKNEMVWQALLMGRENLTELVLEQKEILSKIESELLEMKELDLVKTQQQWFKSSYEIFENQLNQKAMGHTEVSIKVDSEHLIKLALTIEEKNSIKAIIFDFTNTTAARTFHTASHVVESMLIYTTVEFYKLNGYLSQSILDKIKIMLPPKSIVSKSHPTGYWNLEIQNIISQLVQQTLQDLNTPTRKKKVQFGLNNGLYFSMKNDKSKYDFFVESEKFDFNDFEKLEFENKISIETAQKKDNTILIRFKLLSPTPFNLKIHSYLPKHPEMSCLKINGTALISREVDIKTQDQVELCWKISSTADRPY